jgi:hypothetical protein
MRTNGSWRAIWAVGTALAVALTMGGCGHDKKAVSASPSAGPTISYPPALKSAPPAGALTNEQLPASVKSAAAAAGAANDASGAKASQAAGALIPQASQYVDFQSGAWFLSEAVKPTDAALKQARKLDASLDWTSTYDEPNTEQSMVLSGHLRGLAAETKVLNSIVQKAKAKVISGQVGGNKAVWTDVPGGNVILLIALSDTYTLKAEFSGVDLTAALAQAKLIKPTTEAKWKAGGGVIGDCAPGDSCASVKG